MLNAVFVNQTLRTASGDEELAFKQRQRDLKNYQNKVGLRLPGLWRNRRCLSIPAISLMTTQNVSCANLSRSKTAVSVINSLKILGVKEK